MKHKLFCFDELLFKIANLMCKKLTNNLMNCLHVENLPQLPIIYAVE